MTANFRNRALFAALLFAAFGIEAAAATIANVNTLSLPGFSTGSLSPGLTPSPNNDNEPAASPNAISYNIFFNSGGLGSADLEFNLNNSGGTTEYWVAPTVPGVLNNTGFFLTGFLAELGFGVGSDFVRSGAADGLDFDTPDRDPSAGSVAFPVLTHEADILRWSGALVGFAQIGASFAIDVPDGLQGVHPSGLNRFTLRLTPVAVPEPSSAALLLAGLSVVALRLRRSSR